MLDRLIFYSHFGAGDLFESREFVKEIMQIIPANEYFYAHAKGKRTFIDIPNLQHMSITDESPSLAFQQIGNTLKMNTWIGRESKYVLSQIGCVIDKNYEMFNDMLRSAGYSTLSKPYIEYLPTLDYSYLETYNIDRFMDVRKGRKKALICNGPVQSLQAENFDFMPVIIKLVENHPDIDFYNTQELPFGAENLFYTGWIIKSSDGFDLNEISYLAKFCDLIVGRKSGPFVFAHNKDVWYDANKKSLSFTFAKHSSHFVQGNELPLKKFWSPRTDYSGVLEEIERLL